MSPVNAGADDCALLFLFLAPWGIFVPPRSPVGNIMADPPRGNDGIVPIGAREGGVGRFPRGTGGRLPLARLPLGAPLGEPLGAGLGGASGRLLSGELRDNGEGEGDVTAGEIFELPPDIVELERLRFGLREINSGEAFPDSTRLFSNSSRTIEGMDNCLLIGLFFIKSDAEEGLSGKVGFSGTEGFSGTGGFSSLCN